MKRLIPAISSTFLATAMPVLCLTSLTFLLSGCNDSGSKSPDPMQSSLPSIEIPPSNVNVFRLDNGLTLLVEEDHSAPVVSLQAWAHVGSIHEGEFLGSGVSHILEHMLFKGTERRKPVELARSIQELGGYVNAYTTLDRTVYYIDAPSNGWREALDLLSDAMFHSTLPEEEYKKEMEVVRREFAMGFDDPRRTMNKLLWSTSYTRHPYRQPVIGHLEIFNQLSRDDVMTYYKQHYVPNNMTFVIVGAISADEVKEALAEFTKGVPAKAHQPIYIPEEPKQLGRREAHKPFPTDATRLTLAWHIPGITHEDVYALDVLALIAGQGRSSVLHRKFVEKEHLVRSIGAYSYTPFYKGLFGVSSIIPPNSDVKVADLEKRILKTLEQFKTTPVSGADLTKAKRQVIADHASEMKTVSGKAANLGISWLLTRDVHFGDSYIAQIEAVTAEDIMKVANKYLRPEGLTVVSLYPKEKGAVKEEPTSEATSSPLELVNLENGIPIVLKQDRKVPLVTIQAVMKGGLIMETSEINGIGSLFVRLLDKGTPTRSAAQIAQEVEELGGTVDASSGNNSVALAVEMLSPDTPKAIELLADLLLNPAFAQDEFDKEQKKQLSDQILEQDQPMAVARNTLRPTLFGSSPYGLNRLGTPESVKALSPDKLKEFHSKIVSKDNIVLTVGGSFDKDELLKLLNQSFGNSVQWPETQPTDTDSTFNGTGQTIVVDTDKRQAIVQVGFPGAQIDSEDRAALEVISEALSGQASSLFYRVREQQSLAYFVGAAQLLGVEKGYFLFYAGTRPDAAEKVRDEILTEIERITTTGFEEREIRGAKAELYGRRLLKDQVAGMTAYVAGLNHLFGLGIDNEAKLNEKIRRLSLEEINAVARKYFSEDNYVCVLVKPPVPAEKK